MIALNPVCCTPNGQTKPKKKKKKKKAVIHFVRRSQSSEECYAFCVYRLPLLFLLTAAWRVHRSAFFKQATKEGVIIMSSLNSDGDSEWFLLAEQTPPPRFNRRDPATKSKSLRRAVECVGRPVLKPVIPSLRSHLYAFGKCNDEAGFR